jgi:hypothetical protein
MIPASVGQAIFGGSFGYTFRPNLPAQVPLTLQLAASQSADALDVKNSGASIVASINSAGAVSGSSFLALGGTVTPIFEVSGSTVALGCIGISVPCPINFYSNGTGGGVQASISATGVIAGTSFSGSGAGLTTGTIPDSALVTAPVTSVSAGTGITSTGGTSPTISNTGIISLLAGTGIAAISGTNPATIGLASSGVGQAQVVNGYADLSSAQTVGGVKTFSSAPISANGFSSASSNYGANAVINGTLTLSGATIDYNVTHGSAFTFPASIFAPSVTQVGAGTVLAQMRNTNAGGINVGFFPGQTGTSDGCLQLYDFGSSALAGPSLCTNGNFLTTGSFVTGSTSIGPTAARVNNTYVPTVYTASGAAVASTVHMVYAQNAGSCTPSGSPAVCDITVTLTGAAAFASTTSYQCNASLVNPSSASSNNILLGILYSSATSFIIRVGGGAGNPTQSFGYSCTGT